MYIFVISIVLFMISSREINVKRSMRGVDDACCCIHDFEKKINILEYAFGEGAIKKRTLCTLS